MTNGEIGERRLTNSGTARPPFISCVVGFSALRYGNIVTYMRMNHMVPPSSKPRK